MSIPLDNLYHFIESCCSQDSLIYRPRTHGSQNIDDLDALRPLTLNNLCFDKRLICWDQEPLYEWVLNGISTHYFLNKFNGRNSSLLVHSCYNTDLDFASKKLWPVFYWAHGIIARDWYRFAEFDKTIQRTEKPLHQFLVYNRSWSGSREYRLKFAEMLIDHDLLSDCRTFFQPNDSGVYYQEHEFSNPDFKINRTDLDVMTPSMAQSSDSARYNPRDYHDCQWEVVLETVFDFPAVFLTEKILRPIAMGVPFVCAGPAHSLQFLRRYGFHTFNDVIDESYDLCTQPMDRMRKIISTMQDVKNLTLSEIQRANHLAQQNRQRFFSYEFLAAVIEELQQNINVGMSKLDEAECPSFRLALSSYKNSINTR